MLCRTAASGDRIAYITGISPINNNFSSLGETFSGRQAVALLTLITDLITRKEYMAEQISF
jgi:hypothetical protein